MRGKFWRQRKRVVKRGWVVNHQCLLQLVFHILYLAFKYLLKKWIKIEFCILAWLWENINGILFLSLLVCLGFYSFKLLMKKKKRWPTARKCFHICLFVCLSVELEGLEYRSHLIGDLLLLFSLTQSCAPFCLVWMPYKYIDYSFLALPFLKFCFK